METGEEKSLSSLLTYCRHTSMLASLSIWCHPVIQRFSHLSQSCLTLFGCFYLCFKMTIFAFFCITEWVCSENGREDERVREHGHSKKVSKENNSNPQSSQHDLAKSAIRMCIGYSLLMTLLCNHWQTLKLATQRPGYWKHTTCCVQVSTALVQCWDDNKNSVTPLLAIQEESYCGINPS